MSLALLAARLNEAAQAGTLITIVYRDGDRETTHRILPIGASNRVLRAQDFASNRVRLFLLPQLTILADLPNACAAPADLPTAFASDEQALAAMVDELQRLGWDVRTANDRLELHRPRMRAPIVGIWRNAPDSHSGATLRRPWTVVAPGLKRAHSFTAFDKALALFMKTARTHAPLLRTR
jgi:hypothetical protein